jgi:5-methylcytosine-specific restriction enzyme A
MAKLKMLAPRVATMRSDRLRMVGPASSWRADKRGANARGYTYRWQKASKAFLSERPLCVHCQARGRITAAAVVDHIEPHRGDEGKFWNEANWQGLCKPCHDRKTKTEGATDARA